MEKRMNSTQFVLIQLLAVAFLSTNGVWVRFSTLGSLNTGFYRMLVATIVILPTAWKDLHLLKKKDWLILAGAGIFFALDIAVFNTAVTITSLANANLLVNMTPFIIIPVSYFVFKEKIPKFFFIGAIIAVAGTVILVFSKAAPTSMNYLGDFLAIVSMVFYALYILMTYRMRDRLPGNVIMFVCTITACLVLFLVAGAREGVQVPTTIRDIWPLVGLGMCQQVIGQGLFVHCQGKLSVNLSTIINLAAPGVAALYSFIIFQETLSLMEIVGIIIVILGIFLVKMQYQSK